MLIKICGITRAQDAEFAAREGADMVGFNFSPRSPRRVDLDTARGLARALKGSPVKKVGVFVDPDEATVLAATEAASLDLVQLHGAESPDFLARLKLPVIKVLRVGPGGALDLEAAASYDMAKFLMLDSRDPSGSGASGGSWDWRQALVLARRYSLFLAGGLDSSNVAEAVRAVRPAGVDTASGVESSPGKKDPRKITAFVRAARAAAA